MEHGQHPFYELFSQLGLPNSDAAIQRFIATHPLSQSAALADAEFWTPTQADFIREAWKQDADWAPVIDQLNNRLHHKPAAPLVELGDHFIHH